ncbi:FAD-binding protein [Halorubrum sp. Ib24]|uniref:FAD-binding protein n=1 Tax=Halorubrum sp. Ib24 TaxID=1383850 RepID=UPI00117ABE29|nr:FAD-binding protein [Halorubrum sp. Ib24]
MARTDTIGPTGADSPDSTLDHDVLVVGGGAAGLSAATFLARYGLNTLVLARGKSAIQQCAVLENFLGFPVGITPDRFLELGRTQVEYEGGTVREEPVERVERVDIEEPPTDAGGEPLDSNGFEIESDDGDYRVRYVLAATAYDGEMFEPFIEEIETDEAFGMVDSENGRTPVDGLYAAGWMTTETVHQAIVSAGHGAHAALSLIRDDIAARYWPAVADHYVDWVVHDGRYAGDEAWDDHTREWFENEILVDDVDSGLADAALEHLKSEFLDRQIGTDERARRDRDGQRALLETMDDDVVSEYAASLDTTDDRN